MRLRNQLNINNIRVDEDNPLFVYLPCGVGGAPGGINFGLKHVFGDAAHCFYAEPVAAPCMTLGLATGRHAGISVYDIGLTNKTIADGLAVPKPSSFVGKTVQGIVSGTFTVDDNDLYKHLYAASKYEKLKIEPSAAAGFDGPGFVLGTDVGRQYLRKAGLHRKIKSITHVLWTTGGRYLPDAEYKKCLSLGKAFADRRPQKL